MTYKEFEFLRTCAETCGGLEIEITGHSMHPVLVDGERVRLEWVNWEEIRPYDIVAYFNRDALLCHYFWSRSGDRILCRALNFKGADHVEASMLLGRVAGRRVPLLNRVWSILSGP